MKGQSALDYLVTYGWSILVILVVLAVLWYYGIFDPDKWTTVTLRGELQDVTEYAEKHGSYDAKECSVYYYDFDCMYWCLRYSADFLEPYDCYAICDYHDKQK